MYKFLFLCFLFISCGGGGGGGGGTTVSSSDKVFSLDFSEGEMITIDGVDSNGDKIEAEFIFTSKGTTTSLRRNGITISSIYTSSEEAVDQASSNNIPSFEEGFRYGDQGDFTINVDSETYLDVNYVFYGETLNGVLHIVYNAKDAFTKDRLFIMTVLYRIGSDNKLESIELDYSSQGYSFRLK